MSKAWELLNNTAFSKLMIFNVIMSASQCVIVNARQSVLDDWVHMDPLCNAVDQVIGYVLQAITLFCAAKWLKSYNWRGLLAFGTAYFLFFIVTFWLVVFDVGPFRNPWFVVFIDADQTFAQAVGYLVVMWACVEMAPPGIEGTTLALTTTVGNAGQSIGNYITIALNSMFQLSRDDLQAGAHNRHTQMEYFFNALVVMALQSAFMLFFPWMPKSMAHAKDMYTRGITSKAWAVVATILVVFAVVWGAGTNIGAVICPNNSILGGHGGIGACKDPPATTMAPLPMNTPSQTSPRSFGISI